MKIGILSYHFPPEPAFIPGTLVEELVARGHEVRVLTGFPQHPGGRTYPGWRQYWRYQTYSERLTVRRVPRYPSEDSSMSGRLSSYLSFAGSATLVGSRYLSGVDALYIHQSPATTFAAGALLGLLRKVPTVLHVQRLWPEEELATGGFWRNQIAATTRRVYQASQAVAVTAPSMRALVVAEGADPARVSVVLNWTDERIFRPITPGPAAQSLIRRDGRCVLMYAGTIGPRQQLETAVRAAAAVSDKVDLVVIGHGSERPRLQGLAADLGADNVRFVDHRPPTEMPELYAAADYQLVSLRDLPALRGRVPAKLQAALSCASPVVASAAGDTAELVERARAGLSCTPEDWTVLADRFWLASLIPPEERTAMGRRGRAAYLDGMSLRAGVDHVERLLYQAAQGQPVKPPSSSRG